MKSSVISFLLLLLPGLTGCHTDTLSHGATEKGPFVKSRRFYCLDGSRSISEDNSAYNADSLKMTEVYFLHGFTNFDRKDSTVFEYDQNKRLQHQITYHFENEGEPYASTTVQDMTYSGNDLTHQVSVTKKVQSLDSTVSDALYYYEHGQKTRMDNTTTYTFDHTKRLYSEVYNYSGSSMTTKFIFVDGNLYRTINYYYSNTGILIREEDFSSARTLINTIVYTYNSDGLLITDTSDDYLNEYFYKNGLLVEQHQTYSGIDPGFSSCNANYKITYHY